MTTPPTGSRITITREGPEQVLRIPQQSKGVTSYFGALFLIFWLGGWVFGLREGLAQWHGGEERGFITFWLAGWTLGGVFAVFFLYRLLRPASPETFLLRSSGMVHDSGMPPLRMSFGHTNQQEVWRTLFFRRIRRQFGTADLRTLRLREVEGGNRLTIDHGGARLELGTAATEIEREWLYRYLSRRYGLGAGR